MLTHAYLTTEQKKNPMKWKGKNDELVHRMFKILSFHIKGNLYIVVDGCVLV